LHYFFIRDTRILDTHLIIQCDAFVMTVALHTSLNPVTISSLGMCDNL